MKKLIFVILLFTGMASSQTYYGIEDKVAFNDTVKWVQFDSQIGVDLVEGTAEWFVYGYDSNFQPLIKRKLVVSYSGQAITVNAQKNATASKLNLTYNGQEQ